MIPKILHFIWLGNNEKNELVKKCIQSWKEFCPDYEIKEWNDASISGINNTFFLEALEQKKWAFASDYLRLYALSKFGGFYCDSDLEITQPIDSFRENSFFTGFELGKDGQGDVYPITALMGSTPNHKIILDLLNYYDDRHFVVNGKLDLTTNTKIISQYFEKHYGIDRTKLSGEETVHLSETEKIYPYYFFCTPKVGTENYSIHHFNASWIQDYVRKQLFSIGKLRFFQIKQQKKEAGVFPLQKDEIVLLRFSFKKQKRMLTLTLN